MYKSEYDEIKANLIKKSLEKDSTEVCVPIERRKGNDGLITFINIISFSVWAILLMIFALISKAGQSIGNIERNNLLWADISFWNKEILNLALIMTVVCFFVCTICILLNCLRNKRRTDKIKKPLIIGELTCFVIGIFLIFKLF